MADSGPSRIIEIGDARFLTGGRDVDAAGSLIVPALTASVRGYAARRWLTARALDAMARLGVARLRWHVGPALVGPAMALAATRSAPGRPTIEVVSATDPPSHFVLSRAPRRPVSRALADVLDALGAWRAQGRSATSVMGPEAGPTAPPVPLTRDAPASFLVLKPGPPSAPEDVVLDAVYVDGRALALPDLR